MIFLPIKRSRQRLHAVTCAATERYFAHIRDGMPVDRYRPMLLAEKEASFLSDAKARNVMQ